MTGRTQHAAGIGFTQRVLTLAPGQSCPFVETDWVDAIVLVALGVVEVEGLGGTRHCFGRGDLLWLSGLPVRAVHNTGAGRAALVAVSRATPPAADHESCGDP